MERIGFLENADLVTCQVREPRKSAGLKQVLNDVHHITSSSNKVTIGSSCNTHLVLIAVHSMSLCRLQAPSRSHSGRKQHVSRFRCHADRAVEDMLVLELKEELKSRNVSYAGLATSHEFRS